MKELAHDWKWSEIIGIIAPPLPTWCPLLTIQSPAGIHAQLNQKPRETEKWKKKTDRTKTEKRQKNVCRFLPLKWYWKKRQQKKFT